jgi:ubiquinone/menaquinone biosynthesis C-methylase UbiE
MAESRYLLGHTDTEIRRLIFQATMLEATTTRLLTCAGIKPGMRILDVGCGPGDVSMLAARLIGPEGTVTGIDRSVAAIERAQHRTTDSGLKNVTFFQASMEEFIDGGPFDMVIGRYVLMYQPEPLIFQRIEWARGRLGLWLTGGSGRTR